MSRRSPTARATAQRDQLPGQIADKKTGKITGLNGQIIAKDAEIGLLNVAITVTPPGPARTP